MKKISKNKTLKDLIKEKSKNPKKIEKVEIKKKNCFKNRKK